MNTPVSRRCNLDPAECARRAAIIRAAHAAGLRTYAMIAPLLPRTENLVPLLAGKVDHILVDRLNYHYADHIFRKLNREQYLRKEYYSNASRQIERECRRLGITCRVIS